MTHFTVGIIIPPLVQPDEIRDYIDDAMAPFDENAEVEPYISYSLEKARKDIEEDIRRFERIIERQDPNYNLEKCRAALEELCRTTSEQRYHEYIRHHENFDDDGEPLSTCNPDSKWDWFAIGGRWDGWINGREASNESVADNVAATEEALARNKIPHAIVTPDGQWHEHGQMGWWGIMVTENEGWESQAKDILRRHPGHRILILDAHI